MIQAEPINARFVGGPLDGETHRLAHTLPFVQTPAPGETFFARLHAERPDDVADAFLYRVAGADDETTLVYRSLTLPVDTDTSAPAPANGLPGL